MSDTSFAADKTDLVAEADAAVKLLSQVRAEIGKVVFGQERVVELTLAAILGGGHALLIGAPGLAKTKLVETAARALGLAWGRIQFTPDLMPGDILGSEILDESDRGRSFRFVKGPIFTSLLMADEINRASPRTQSALLQAMQERHVTVAGARHDLPQPFHVLATQNPIEQEGTYPLPEAQLDRFLLKVDVDYPDAETERRILVETTGVGDQTVRPALDSERLLRIQRLVRSMPVPETVLEAILRLVRSARPEQSDNPDVKKRVEWGPSPRAGQALMLAVRARALLRGRLAPSLDDVEALAEPALGHRMSLAYDPAGGNAGALSALITQLASKLT
jgi:MoxR-like ATPase